MLDDFPSKKYSSEITNRRRTNNLISESINISNSFLHPFTRLAMRSSNLILVMLELVAFQSIQIWLFINFLNFFRVRHSQINSHSR
jgi:hypothetical protein